MSAYSHASLITRFQTLSEAAIERAFGGLEEIEGSTLAVEMRGVIEQIEREFGKPAADSCARLVGVAFEIALEPQSWSERKST